MMIGVDVKKNADLILGLFQMSLFSIEATININLDGIKICIHDKANICFGCLKYKKEGLSSYDVTSPQSFRVNLKEFKTIVSKAKSGIIFLLYENGKFSIRMVGKTEKNFELALFDDSEDIIEYNREYEHKGIVDTEDITESITDISYIETGIVFLIEGDKLSVSTGDEMKKARILVNIDGNIPSNTKSTFSQDYVQNIFSKKVTDKVTIGMGKDFPLLVIFQNENIELKYYLAPRISDD